MRTYKSHVGALIVCVQVIACASQGFEGGRGKPSKQSNDANAQTGTSSAGSSTVIGRTAKELEKPEEIFKKPKVTPVGTPIAIPTSAPGKPQVSADFNKLCAGAQTATIFAASAGLKSVLGELCDGNTAKPLLTSTLLSNAYTGVGPITFTTLRDLISDKDAEITSTRFAYAMKLPVQAKDYYDRALLKSLTLEGVKGVVEGPGGTATVSNLQAISKDGPTHHRGISVHQILEKNVEGHDVTVESDNRYDHHIVEDGFSYFATNIVTKPISSIKTSDMLGMIVRLGDASYLIAVVDTSVNNRGFEGIATRELARSILVGSDALYKRIIDSSKP